MFWIQLYYPFLLVIRIYVLGHMLFFCLAPILSSFSFVSLSFSNFISLSSNSFIFFFLRQSNHSANCHMIWHHIPRTYSFVQSHPSSSIVIQISTSSCLTISFLPFRFTIQNTLEIIISLFEFHTLSLLSLFDMAKPFEMVKGINDKKYMW